jgi:hypothetical protein
MVQQLIQSLRPYFTQIEQKHPSFTLQCEQLLDIAILINNQYRMMRVVDPPIERVPHFLDLCPS